MEKHPEWFSVAGDPDLPLVALTFNTYRDHLYLAGIPAIVQKVLFAAWRRLRALGGYRIEIEPKN